MAATSSTIPPPRRRPPAPIPAERQAERAGVGSSATVGLRSRVCLSVDVEEYFHCEVYARRVAADRWSQLPRRAAPFVERIAELLAQHDSRATFFVLGWMVPQMRSLLGALVRAGHEIACHGDQHAHLARMTPAGLREDLKRARGRIEDALGVRPRGYRAPTFSLTRATAWALEEIVAAGFEYDSSIFPIRHDRYGVPDAPLAPFRAVGPSGAAITEIPPLTVGLGPLRLPVGGGGYLRLLPGGLMRRCVAARAGTGHPVMTYVHPWELDPHQPRLAVSPVARWRHGVNLRTTDAKLDRLLGEFGSETAARLLAQWGWRRVLPSFHLAT